MIFPALKIPRYTFDLSFPPGRKDRKIKEIKWRNSSPHTLIEGGRNIGNALNFHGWNKKDTRWVVRDICLSWVNNLSGRSINRPQRIRRFICYSISRGRFVASMSETLEWIKNRRWRMEWKIHNSRVSPPKEYCYSSYLKFLAALPFHSLFLF